MRDCPWASVEDVNTSAPPPSPKPGPAPAVGPDVDELRSTFEDLLSDSAGRPDRGDDEEAVDDGVTVGDHQVEALDAAHELLAGALTELDSTR